MDIKRAGSQASTVGSPEYFTGQVRIEPIISATDPARVAAANVTFEPGARTTWHTHPLGQTLHVMSGEGRIASRIGIGEPADTFGKGEDLFAKIQARLAQSPISCIFIDEAQFLSKDQVWQLARAVDDLNVPVMTYGLRLDFQGNLFPGSASLLALADEMREVRTICHCGKKATMVVRTSEDGTVLTTGAQVEIGGNERYVSLCRRHWRQETGDQTPE